MCSPTSWDAHLEVRLLFLLLLFLSMSLLWECRDLNKYKPRLASRDSQLEVCPRVVHRGDPHSASTVICFKYRWGKGREWGLSLRRNKELDLVKNVEWKASLLFTVPFHRDGGGGICSPQRNVTQLSQDSQLSQAPFWGLICLGFLQRVSHFDIKMCATPSSHALTRTHTRSISVSSVCV